jgi:hypothetical protein
MQVMETITKNNSASMKTVVEAFIIEETQELIYDNEKLDQWNAMVAELGLTGQEQVVKTNKSPIPFLWMNQTIKSVFEELCPAKVKVEEYSKTPIPVEALSMISLSVKEGYFDKIEVWYNDKSPDPAVIGYKYNKGVSQWDKDWYADRYLLARWSDVKATLAELTERAKKLFVLRRSNELKVEISTRQRQLEDIEIESNTKFGFATPDSGVDIPF